jgi:prepilin-type N-terminal cleavage/methylation domain-containing protein
MSQPKLSRQKGFTIIELLIVIVVIGILAALVLTSFAGVQARARDTERQTDVNSIAAQLEAYYANTGNYPTFAQMDDDPTATSGSFYVDNLKGLDDNALKAPNGTGVNNLTATTTPTLVQYGYVPAPTGCDNGAGGTCSTFTLYWRAEAETGQPVKEKKSVN